MDFWATWCGPCQRSMPHVEKIYEETKGQDVVVLGICVLDDRAAYDAWIPAHKSDYAFTFAFDPAGRNSSASIASNLYHVDGIPTTYVIGKGGNVVEALVGFGGSDDHRIEAVLTTLRSEPLRRLEYLSFERTRILHVSREIPSIVVGLSPLRATSSGTKAAWILLPDEAVSRGDTKQGRIRRG